MKSLLLIPSYAKSSIGAEIAADCHPTMDYLALVESLGRQPGDTVEMFDYASVDRAQHPAVQFVCRLAGRDAALALMGFLRRHEFDTIFTNAETLALPLALLFRAVPDRPRHVTIAHRLTARKKQVFYRWLKLHRQMDLIFVYSSTQHSFACAELGIPRARVRLIPFHADHRFFRPLTDLQEQAGQICAAGLEWRDYPTLIRAVSSLGNLCVKLAAASPWSRQTSEIDRSVLPSNVSARSYGYLDLRALYAQSSFVVVPLYDNDFQAGVTTILEAMAMGKPVIVSRTQGQQDVIAHEQNGLYVEPGNVEALRAAIDRLSNDEALRQRLGRAARRWVEEQATLEHWVEQIVAGLRGVRAPASTDSDPLADPVSGDSEVAFDASMALLASTRQFS